MASLQLSVGVHFSIFMSDRGNPVRRKTYRLSLLFAFPEAQSVLLFVQQINTDYHRVVFRSVRNCQCMINERKWLIFFMVCRFIFLSFTTFLAQPMHTLNRDHCD